MHDSEYLKHSFRHPTLSGEHGSVDCLLQCAPLNQPTSPFNTTPIEPQSLGHVGMEQPPPSIGLSPITQSESNESPSSEFPKLPPCDQCRRRKVKCDGKKVPCDRCTSSRLTCTRDIARKKRGPKKGSGSVIAKLRDEHEYGFSQEPGLPPFDLSSLELQVPKLHRALSDDSPLGSPLDSPMGSQFGDVLPPTSDPSMMPRSVPLTLQNGMPPRPTAGFSQGGIQFPASWQVPPSDLLQYQTPTASNGYVSVSDLAQQIFHDPATPVSVPHTPNPRSLQPSPPKMDPQLMRPTSLDAYLNTQQSIGSPATTAASSPMPFNGPKYLYRSDSGNYQTEVRLSALAAEVGMSAYLLSQCLKQYFRHIYPICPIIHETTLSYRLSQNEELTMEEKVLVLSMCAVVAVHASPQTDLSLERKLQLGKQFTDLCINMRKSYDWIEAATVASVQASYHICVALFELKKPKSHHFYMREAIGIAHELGLHLELTYVNMNKVQAICCQRTFAVLFITERGYAILRNKPASIAKLPYIPSEHFDESDKIVLSGFIALTNLFSILDDKFVNLWRSTPGDGTSQEPLDNIAAIQHSLNDISFDGTTLTDIQKADVLITHQWLRLIFWQASMRQGLITVNSADQIFRYDYPIVIAKNLCRSMEQLTMEAILVHGLGIFEKIFEVAYTLMDALTLAKVDWTESIELRYLFGWLSSSPNSQNTYVKMLETKMDAERSPMNSPGGG